MPFICSWLLNGVYALLLLAVSPILIYRRLAFGKYRGGWREKLTGRVSRRFPERRCLWFHAVSVGEVLQLQKVLDEAAALYPDAELFVTTTTDTGYDVARNKYPQHTVSYFPLDFSWAVNRALDAIRPDLVVLVELELWPNFIRATKRHGIPLALINGRIGENSFRGYSRVKPLLQRVLACFDVLAVQNATFAQRLCALGAPVDRVKVTGNIKFDRVDSRRDNPRTNELRAAFGLANDERIFIAGSTQETEEAMALDVWAALRGEFPDLRLILVPRHKERFEDVAQLVRARGLPLLRRSETIRGATSTDAANARRTDEEPSPVLLLDTLGELAGCWGLADIAFVGGSMTNRGGQNMLEPAAYGAAVLFGPNTWNFKDIAESLLSLQAARVVHGVEDLRAAIRSLLLHPVEARRMGDAAREFVGSQQGATSRTIKLLVDLVPAATSGNAEQRAA
jgi:3-deoxy-D-manno-octulosonic-acid transferase